MNQNQENDCEFFCIFLLIRRFFGDSAESKLSAVWRRIMNKYLSKSTKKQDRPSQPERCPGQRRVTKMFS